MARPTKKQAYQNMTRLRECRTECQNPQYPTAAEFVRAVRKYQGKDTAERGGLNEITYGRFETGKRPLSKRYAKIFGEMLGVNPDYLTYESNDKSVNDQLVNTYIGYITYFQAVIFILRERGYNFRGILYHDTAHETVEIVYDNVNKKPDEKKPDGCVLLKSEWLTADYTFMFLRDGDVVSVSGKVFKSFADELWNLCGFLFDYTVKSHSEN